MAKKKHKPPHPPAASDLRPRVERASREGRFQQALELAKQLFKYEPTPENRERLRQTYLGRARQLRTTGYARDAVTVLDVALQLEGADAACLQQIAQEFALNGEASRALALTDRLPPDSADRSRVLAQVADAAVRQGVAGRASLPAELHADFDRVLQASSQIEAGQDEPALATLQPVGLRSPFLEWKLFLRGLSAHYRGDDARAAENWQRLGPERLPARLAAPLRFTVDAAFAAAQAPAQQNALRQQADRVQGQDLSRRLRDLQKVLAEAGSLPRAFRLAEDLLPALRQQAPRLVPRLASCFYWAVINNGNGEEEDEKRYRRAFGPPPDDAAFARLRALVSEHEGYLEDAHAAWQEYERGVAANPSAWPGGQAARVRALVWKHMGLNALAVPEVDDSTLPPFLRDHPNKPRPLKPSAEDCFKKSLDLAPDQVDTHDELVRLYLGKDQPKKAEKAARDLLARFPAHVPTLGRLADLRVKAQDYPEGITLLEQALRADPLDRRLRTGLATARLFQARAHAEAGRFDDARAEFRAALSVGGEESGSVYCKMAACEFKAGDAPKAEEYLDKAVAAAAGSRLSVAYSMVIEATRLRLPPKLKARFNKEFNDLLGQPPDAASAALIAENAAAHQSAGVTYHGQKTHEKKVLAYLKKAVGLDMSEGQLDKTCRALLALKAPPALVREYAAGGQRRFPNNPYFLLWEVETYVAKGVRGVALYRARALLENARRLVAALPPGSEKERLQEMIRSREEMMAVVSPFGGLGGFMDAFENMFGDDDGGGW